MLATLRQHHISMASTRTHSARTTSRTSIPLVSSLSIHKHLRHTSSPTRHPHLTMDPSRSSLMAIQWTASSRMSRCRSNHP
jgi:hypothetical protein